MEKSFLKDVESSEDRMDAWSDGKVTAKERRVLYTKWLGDAWDAIQERRIIESAFKSCGFANDINGKENHLMSRQIRSLSVLFNKIIHTIVFTHLDQQCSFSAIKSSVIFKVFSSKHNILFFNGFLEYL